MIDKSLVDLIKKLRCCACGKRGVDIAHIKSRGAGGSDEAHNLLPLCRVCHSIQHSQGWRRFIEDHPGVLKALLERGWKMGFVNGQFKMLHAKECKDGRSNVTP